MKYLFIAEKPSLKRNVESVYNTLNLPYQADFLNAAGHLVRRAKPSEYEEEMSLPMLPSPLKMLIIDETKGLYNAIAKQVKAGHYDALVNCCDPEREGQHIFKLIIDQIHWNGPCLRFWCNSLTHNEIAAALNNLENNNTGRLKRLTDASMARGDSDWYMGMNLSKKVNCSIGRVKTPTLSIVVNRDLEIENHVEKITYSVHQEYAEGFDAILVAKSDKDKFEDVHCETKDEANEYISTFSPTAKVVSYHTKNTKKYAPPLFKLSDLQTSANKEFGYNADKVMEILQSLYEKGIMSYPRTDCRTVSSEFAKQFPSLLNSLAQSLPDLKPYVNKITNENISRVLNEKKYVNDEEVSENGHTGLCPTGSRFDPSTLNEGEMNILGMISKRFISIFMEPVKETSCTVLVENNNNLLRFTGKKTIDKSFMELLGKETKDNFISVSEGDTLHVSSNDVKEIVSKPPARFTDGTLIQAMENPSKYLIDTSLSSTIKLVKGIGTPATRSPIINNLVKEGLLERKKGKGKSEYIISTKRGRAVIKMLEGHDIVRVDTTAQWENRLSDIATGKLSLDDYMTSFKEYIIKELSTYNTVLPEDIDILGKCPKCGADYKAGKFGAYCSAKCGMQIAMINGKKLTTTQIKTLLTNKKIKLSGLKSKNSNKTYTALFTVQGIEPFKYKDKDGNNKTGYQFKYKMTFPK